MEPFVASQEGFWLKPPCHLNPSPPLLYVLVSSHSQNMSGSLFYSYDGYLTCPGCILLSPYVSFYL